MPKRMWKVVCGCWSGWMGGSTCSHCGHRNEYTAWRYGMHERMAIFQYRYGVRPIGPHLKLATELIGPHIKLCEHCGGEGLLTDRTTDRWQWCTACEAIGSTVTCDAHTLRRIHERIGAEFPGAVVPPVHPLKRAGLILDLGKGEIIGPEEQEH